MPYTWEFTVYAEAAYPLGVENHGFADPADEAKYDRLMKTCRFFYPFWAEVSEATKIVERYGNEQDRQDLMAAVKAHYTTRLAFLPARTTWNSIRDMGSVPAKAMKKLKRGKGIAENQWDKGFRFWKTQNRRRIPGWIRV